MQKKNIPAVRFASFMGEWERKRLARYATFYTGNGLSWDDISESGTRECILYGNLYTDYGMIADNVICRTNKEIKNPVFSEFGDVLIPASDTTPTGLARATSIEKSGVLLGGDINIVRPKKEINGSCLSLAINANKSELIKLIKGTTVRHIHNSEIQNIKIALPIKFTEQEKIVSYFKALDRLITLNKQKYERLQNIKKAMLGKMFPKEGARVPEIRFSGFLGEWERKRVSDLFKITRGYVLAATLTVPTKTAEALYPVYSSQTKDNGLLGYYKDYLYENAITWTTDGANAGTVNYRAGKFYCTNVCGVLLSNKVNANQMIAEALNNVAKNYVSYVGNPKLMNNVMADIEIQIPRTCEEREQISQFLSCLDRLIILNKQKYERLQNIKTAMLQRMFV